MIAPSIERTSIIRWFLIKKLKLESIIGFETKPSRMLIKCKASLTVSDRNIIHPMFTRKKVNIVLAIETALFLGTMIIKCLIKRSTHTSIPRYNPQAIKVQLAPCHNPLMVKTLNKLISVLGKLQWLPPRG